MRFHRTTCRNATGATRAGLTLLELLAVLMILAITTTVAVVSVEGVLDQSRYEATQRTLTDIEEAILGPANAEQPDGTLPLCGFVADMGRLPASLDELTGGLPPGAYPFGVQSFDSDGDGANDVTVASGWRGPYLRLAAGQGALLDGWGRPFEFTLDTGTGELTVASLGADGLAGGSDEGYNRDMSLTVRPEDYAAGLVTFHLRELDEGGNEQDPVLDGDDVLQVCLYRADGTGQTSLDLRPADPATFQCPVPNLPLGTIAARALLRDAPDGPIKKKSAPLYVNVHPRANWYRKLVLR